MHKDIKMLHKSAQQALNQGDYQQAHHCLLAILSQDKYFADAYFLLAMIASAHHNVVKTIELIKQANVLAPDNAEYLSQLAKHYALENDHVQAVHFAELSAKLSPISALTLDTIGVAYSQIGLHQKAVVFFKKAVSIKEDNVTFYFNLGASLKFTGDFDGAKKAYQKTIKLAPLYYKAHAALTSLGGISTEHNHIKRLESIYQQAQLPDEQLYIGHALAREHEALGDFDKSFTYLYEAKQSKLKSIDYSIENDKKLFASLEHNFTHLNQEPSNGCSSQEPIFVVGMPRTGTTLVERIISQHPEVTSAGELQHFGLLLKKMSKTLTNKVLDQETVIASDSIDFKALGQAYIESTRAITGSTAKFVDKMPLNVLYVGFIIMALPNAKIVCLDRNPLDTIVSNFRQLFTVNQSYYDYSFDLSSTAEFYLLFKKLVNLWVKLFPDNFYLVDYEKLVNDPLNEAKKIMSFCQLSWQDNYINIEQNSAPVATASALQVRSPINNRSIGNWKKYEKHLKQVISILKQANIDLV